ncbi:MAG: branched-chain amino acid transport system II carrier protein [Gammaproteobacteria bacterium]
MQVFKQKITWVTGIAIFSMFFGAGNVVFPLTLGFFAGDEITWALLGLLVTAIGGPLLGLFAAILYEGNCTQFFSRIGKVPGNALIFLALCLLGPFAVMPRCFIVAFEAVRPFMPTLTLFQFSLISAFLVVVSIAKREWLLGLLGYILSPVLIISLLSIIFFGVYSDITLPHKGISATSAFKQGLLVGYDTMDLMAALFFAAPIWYLLKESLAIKTLEDKVKKLIPVAIGASLIGGAILALIYIGLSWVSASNLDKLEGVPLEAILSYLAVSVLGVKWSIISNIAIALACITTVMSLAVMLVEVLDQEFNFWHWMPDHTFSYSGSILLIMMITVFFANLGFTKLMSIIHPIVMVCYPAIVVLTICNILYKLFGFKPVKIPFAVVLISTLLYTVSAHALSQDPPTEIRITIGQSVESPSFEPKDIQMKVDHRYTLKITNPHPVNLMMEFDNLNTAIVTHYVNGASKVDYNTIGLPPEQTIEWSFTPLKKGRFRFYESGQSDRPDQNLVSYFEFNS